MLLLSPIVLLPALFILLLLGLLYGLLVGGASGFSEVEALFVYALYGVYLAPSLRYVGQLILARIQKQKTITGESNSYAVSVIDAGLSSTVVLGAASLASFYDKSLPPATYCALIAFIGFFVLNLGYNFTTSEQQAVIRDFLSDQIDPESGPTPGKELSPEIINKIKDKESALLSLKTGQIHYVHFLIAPFVAVVIWLFVKPHLSILGLNLIVLFGLVSVSIFVHTMVKAFVMATSRVPALDAVSTREYTLLYIYLSRVRHLMLYDNCHDLAVLGVIGFSAAEFLKGGDLASIIRPLSIVVVCLAVFSAFLPFYWGQRLTLEAVVNGGASDYSARDKLRRALIAEAPLYPQALPLAPLLTVLGAGGCLTFFVKQFFGTT